MKPFLPLLIAATLAAACSHKEMTLMTYNVGVFSKYQESSLPEVARLILHSEAAAVALNELDSCNRRHNTFQLKELSDSLGAWDFHFASAFPFAGGAYGNGVASREKVLRSYTIGLPRADGAEPRSAAVVETASCVLAAVHLDHVSENARLEQVRVLNGWFEARYLASRKPVFLCGDLNDPPESATLPAVLQEWELLSGIAPTHPANDPQGCIDYILRYRKSAPVKVLSSKVLTEGTQELSDHCPILLRVRL